MIASARYSRHPDKGPAMRSRLLPCLMLTAGTLIGTLIGGQVQASSDDACYPDWAVLSERLDPCSSLPFLSPGNDSAVNLRLLLADAERLPITPAALTPDDLAEGYGEVPFAHYRLQPVPAPVSEADAEPASEPGSEGEAPAVAGLDDMLATLGIKRETSEVAGDTLLDGEGSRCRSNNETTAADFIRELINTQELAPAERAALAASRMQMLSACGWEPEQLSSLLPNELQSPAGKSFALYLQAAADFYSGRLAQASKGFTLLADNPQPWLKDTALYMIGRSELNLAQVNAFEYGELKPQNVDTAAAQRAQHALSNYVDNYPFGVYSTTAAGLLRRVHWLTQDKDRLAADYEALLFAPGEPHSRSTAAYEALVREADLKLISGNTTAVNSPAIVAVNDLMWMREDATHPLTRAALLAQKGTFTAHPQLFTYLQAAFALYVENDPAAALQQLPGALPDDLTYLAFSAQMLRGLALESSQASGQAQALWLSLLPLAKRPLQREQLQLALAMSYERDEQLSKVFATDSPITSEKLRYILLSHAADADLLRQQATQAASAVERNTALFVLLYKDLMRSQFAAFGTDLARLNALPSDDHLGYSLGYVHDQGPTLALFGWQGDKAESGYLCPALAETAAALANDATAPRSLNCMGEFILRNRLDGMPLDQRRRADTLGGTAPGFAGTVFSRHGAYQAVLANPGAGHEDKAYALFRVINCYAPSGYNGCGGKDVEPSVRKAWFKQLKSRFGDTRWGQSLQYYW
jgi:hypothetical protein